MLQVYQTTLGSIKFSQFYETRLDPSQRESVRQVYQTTLGSIKFSQFYATRLDPSDVFLIVPKNY